MMREYALLEGKRDLEPMGVVDIGSNSVRLVVYEGAVRSPTPIFNEKVLCGLGREIASTGRLDEESVKRALEALTRFRAMLRLLDVKHVRAIATAACRDAANGPDFIVRGEKALGTRIQVLSGQQEAELAANGILMGFRSPDGLAGDLGGGSLEIIDVAGNALRQSATLPLGGLRLLDASGGRIDKAIDIVDEQIASVAWRGKGRGRTFYAVGGTWRAIARLHMSENGLSAARDARLFHAGQGGHRLLRGYSQGQEAVGDEGLVRDRPAAARGAAVRRAGARAAAEADSSRAKCCSRYSASARAWSMAFCRKRNGARIRCSRFAPTTRACAPGRPSTRPSCANGPTPCSSLRARPRPKRKGACGMRRASCRTSAGARIRTIAASRVSSSSPNPPWAASTIRDGFFWRLPSIFAMWVAGREDDEQTDSLSGRLKEIAPKKLYRRARIIGAAIRAAHMLSIGRPGIIDETPLAYEKGKLVLSLPEGPCSARRRTRAPPIRGPGPAAGAGAGGPHRMITPIPVSLAHGRHDRHLAV